MLPFSHLYDGPIQHTFNRFGNDPCDPTDKSLKGKHGNYEKAAVRSLWQNSLFPYLRRCAS